MVASRKDGKGELDFLTISDTEWTVAKDRVTGQPNNSMDFFQVVFESFSREEDHWTGTDVISRFLSRHTDNSISMWRPSPPPYAVLPDHERSVGYERQDNNVK